MKKYLTCLVICFQGFINLYGQTDTQFWFAVPEVEEANGDRPIILEIAAKAQGTSVTISIPANSDFTPIIRVLQAYQVIRIDITQFIDDLENIEPNVVANKGLLIESVHDISVYYEVIAFKHDFTKGFNNDIFVLKGRNALGTDFYVPFQNKEANNNSFLGNKDSFSSIDVVATEDSTDIELYYPNHIQSGSKKITLNRGQTYSFRAFGQKTTDHWYGARIVADKFIAVTMKDDAVTNKENSSALDLIGDQLVPVDVVGRQYILGGGTAYIVTTKEFTKVKIGIFSEILFDAGDYRAITLPETPILIEADQPICILHVVSNEGQYGGAIAPPIDECTGVKEVNFAHPEYLGLLSPDTTITVASNGLMIKTTILIKKGGEDEFLLNGEKNSILDQSVFQEVSGSNGEWLYTIVNLQATGNKGNLIQNKTEKFHISIQNTTNLLAARLQHPSHNTSTFFGYLSDFVRQEFSHELQFCQGDDIHISLIDGYEAYEWSTGDTSHVITNFSSENIVKDSLLFVKVTNENCIYEDTISVSVGESVKGIDLGEDIELCQGENYPITLNPQYTYQWNDNVKGNNYSVTTQGWHKVLATSQDGCTFEDSLFAKVASIPIAEIGEEDTLICQGNSLVLTLPEGYDAYEWSTGDTSNSITLTEEGTYSVKVLTKTKDKVCGTDQDEITVGFWNVNTYNVLTPNEDGKNDVFVVEGIEQGDWQLEVYNRWGKRVYLDKHYQNTWTAEKLKEGTYFFSLTENNEASCTQFKSWVQVIR
ncbi:MAG: gliding motility-associated C-terminal domain-containing protein [Cytophagales bacterium]|nr:gliding motility-associated C-terminal domain-containing protein [Cytophagales bacterium]